MTKKKNGNYTIGLLQLAFSADLEDNTKKTISWVEKAVKKGAQVICLPELYRSQYFCQTEDSSLF
ncbi:MAG: acyltransferase, partial [Ignavibacteriae bacterium]|nr:acyltransferase [Ignavibacteriota bacterium]